MKKFKDIKIKAGYLLVVETSGERHNMTVIPDRDDDLGCSTPPQKHWWPIYKFDENGKYFDSQVVAIYGRTTCARLLDNSLEFRELLWERKGPKKMTVAEICNELGYEVEITK
jgi:hypothetical protein